MPLEQIGSTYVPSDAKKWAYKGKAMIIGVDFDGTCVKSRWPEPTITEPGSVDVLRTILQAGHRIIIWTCREFSHELRHGPHAGTSEVYNWLKRGELLGYHPNQLRVNSNFESWIQDMGGDSRKIFAHCYIDDRNLGGFPGWDKVLPMLGL